MAKSTTKSQAKTKTTKKPAAKKPAAKKNVSAKAVNKQTKTVVKDTSKKAATVKKKAKPSVGQAVKKPVSQLASADKSVNKKGSSLVQIKRLHIFSAAVFVLLAVGALLLAKAQSYQVTLSHMAQNELASVDATVFAPAIQPVADVDVRIIVVGMLAFSAALSLWRVLRRWAKEQAGLAMHVLGLRWFDLAITGALMVYVVGLMAGITDLALLKALGLLLGVGAIFAWFAERNNVALVKQTWTAFWASVLSLVAVFTLVAVSIAMTSIYGGVRYSWFVYALFAVLAVSGVLSVCNQRRQIKGAGKWADYMYVEKNYLTISLLTKVAFAAIFIAGIAA